MFLHSATICQQAIENSVDDMTYRWEVAQGEHAQKTGLSASTIAYNDQFPEVQPLSAQERRRAGTMIRSKTIIGRTQKYNKLMRKDVIAGLFCSLLSAMFVVKGTRTRDRRCETYRRMTFWPDG